MRGDLDGEAVREGDIHDAGDQIERRVLVGLEDERGADAAGGKLIERGAEAVEGDDLVVEIEDGIALQRGAVGIVLLRGERDGDDEAAGRRAQAKGAARRIDLDAGLKHERGAEQEEAEQQQHDVDDRREIDESAQGLESAGKYQGHGRKDKGKREKLEGRSVAAKVTKLNHVSKYGLEHRLDRLCFGLCTANGFSWFGELTSISAFSLRRFCCSSSSRAGRKRWTLIIRPL